MDHFELIKIAGTVVADTGWFKDSSESIFNRLDRIQELLGHMRTAASDSNIAPRDLERLASYITEMDEERDQLERLAGTYVDFDTEEYLQNLPGGTIASQYRVSSAGTADLGEDDGSVLYRIAKDTESQYREADWINFVTAGAESWVEDQSRRLLTDTTATREAAVYYVEEKTLPILDVTKRASIIDNFVTNVEVCRRAKRQVIAAQEDLSKNKTRVASTLNQHHVDDSFGDSVNWF